MIALKLKRVLTGCEIGLKLRCWNVTGINVKSYIWVDKKKVCTAQGRHGRKQLGRIHKWGAGSFCWLSPWWQWAEWRGYWKSWRGRGWRGRERLGGEKQPWPSPCRSACVPSQMKHFKGSVDKLEVNRGTSYLGWEHLIIMLKEGWLRFNLGKAGVSNVWRYRSFAIGKNQRTDETMVRLSSGS